MAARREPNLVLRGIRENERGESREQFAAAMTTVARELGHAVFPDAKYVERLESGTVGNPGPVYREILSRLCGRPAVELGLYVPGMSGRVPANYQLREAMFSSGVETRELARKVGVDRKSVERWMTRGVVPHARHRHLVSKILGCPESELWPDAVHMNGLDSAETGGISDAIDLPQSSRLTAIAANSEQNWRVIEALGAIGNDHLGDMADSLGDLVDHYAQTVCALPPARVYDELLSIRSYVGSVIEHSMSAARRNDIVLSTGWLSNLLAVAACDMGEHATARVWCSDAERRSHEARHPELAAWAVLTRALIAFYQGQPRWSVSLAAQGQGIAPIGTVIHAKLAAHEMRAAAMVGDASQVEDARRYAARAIGALPAEAPVTGAFSINLAEDPPYTATSLLFVGQYAEAISATNRVIHHIYSTESRKHGGNPSGYARSLLILGLAQAGAGRIDEAVASGQAALCGSRPAWPTMVLAGKLDEVLARDYPEARETAEYRIRFLEASTVRS